MNKSISIIIPSFNRSVRILSNAVESVFRQDYPISEIIVVDDNYDNPYLSKSIEEFCISNKLIYIQSHGIGASGARNCGINIASGEYIAFLDDDDEWLPQKIKAQMNLFSRPNIGLVYCRGYTTTINANGEISQGYYATDRYYKTKVTYDDLLMRNYIGTTTQIIIKKDILKKLGGFDETLPSRQDYDLCLRVSRKYQCVGSNQHLFIHHIHDKGQITDDPRRNIVGYQMLLRKYKKDIRSINDAYLGFCYRIARCAHAGQIYPIFIKYMILACLNNPLKICESIKKCFK